MVDSKTKTTIHLFPKRKMKKKKKKKKKKTEE
jgi:hypothetical protein